MARCARRRGPYWLTMLCKLISHLSSRPLCEYKVGESHWSNQAWKARRLLFSSSFFIYLPTIPTASRWQCYSSHHRSQRVCYSLLLRLLRTIDADWDPAAVRGDLVGYGCYCTVWGSKRKKRTFHHVETTSHLISSALFLSLSLTFIKVFGSAKNVPQHEEKKHTHTHKKENFFLTKNNKRCTGSYNCGPFLCPGEAAVRQLQAAHRALPVSDEEHASGFPLHQRRRHYTLRAHAEVKSHRHWHHVTHGHPGPPRETRKHVGGLLFLYLPHCSLLIPSTNHFSPLIPPIFLPHYNSEIGLHLTVQPENDMSQHMYYYGTRHPSHRINSSH